MKKFLTTWILLLLLLALFQFFYLNLAIAQEIDIEYLSSTLWTYARDLDVQGCYAYCAFYNGMVIFDVQNPLDPQIISTVSISEARDICVENNYAYVISPLEGLVIIDISDPENPNVICDYCGIDQPRCISVAGNIACITGILGDIERVFILDCSDPSEPILLSRFYSYGVWDFLNIGDKLFSLDGWRTLRIYDISNPEDPVILSNLSLTGDSTIVRGVDVSGNYAYVSCEYGGLKIVDITDPSQPIERGTCNPFACLMGVCVKGGYAYIANLSAGLIVFDINDPDNPIVYETFNTPEQNWYVKCDEGRLYTTCTFSFQIFDTDPLHALSNYDISGYSNDVCIREGIAYISTSSSQFEIVDISNPYTPFKLGSVDFGYGGDDSNENDVEIQGNYAYVTIKRHGIRIVDISNPTLPFVVGSYDDGLNRFISIDVSQNYVYALRKWSNEIVIIDISNPADPRYVNSYFIEEDNSIYNFTLKDNLVFITCMDEDCLRIIDVSNPLSPILLGGYDFLYRRNPYDVAVRDDCAYVVSRGGYIYLELFNISDLTAPVPISSCSTDVEFIQELTICLDEQGHYAYVTAWDYGFFVFDVSDLSNPYLAGRYNTSGFAWKIDVKEENIFVADMTSLQIFLRYPTKIDNENLIPTNFSLSQNYPNPFNASTMIEFSLPHPADVQLDIYDILGRKVETLLDCNQTAGYHQITWHASDVSSGIYFYKIQAGDIVETKSMLLLK